ncbi:NADH-quinone oxidoreductase subunit H [Roseococcus sp. SDR]|uniref:respiratory chain complex I subunit 1 family protein n=1 Tax=Roseococcus sp. SDR TaxID=2835532 RepID=UPI001BD132C9|nr:NADH-quinone oxidoreductase subunit H [Roseococcus sp. SDR]MBS7788785.1 NADH-quinone oxidoreductase subunit H [Roseococcus sp. SDR]MBV1844099.1 NADH-quinone oxidoreductase subunit H [Roseococcus sp. SDR]
MAVLGGLLTQLLHIALMLAVAPLLVGVVRWLKSRLMGRRGPHPMQPWRDLLKLLRKRPVLAEGASLVSRVSPYVALGATVLAAALVPSFAFGMALAPMADLLLIGGLLALARVALALNGHDAGTPFGGLGAAREMTFAVFAEPALMVCVMVFAVLIGGTNLNAIGHGIADGQLGLRVSLIFAAVALAAVALAENARVPVDNPATHLELTMVHEAMLLEASGRHLALWEMQAALKLLVWLGLLATLFLPYGTAAPGSGPFAWGLGLVLWGVKIGLLALALAVFESAIAKMRVFRVPEFLGGALMLALLAAALIFVSTGLA